MRHKQKDYTQKERMESESRRTTLPRFLIADGHAIFAEGLRFFLEKTYIVVGVVRDGRAMVQEAVRLRPDVIVVDICIPFLNGLDAAERIKAQAPNVKFIFLTMCEDPSLAAATLKLGAVGFLLKHSTNEQELAMAIKCVLDGKMYLTPKMGAEGLGVTTSKTARQFAEELTPRQREIVQLYGEGRTIKEIARILNLSEKTVEFHKHRIMQRLKLNTNAEIVLLAVKLRLVFP